MSSGPATGLLEIATPILVTTGFAAALVAVGRALLAAVTPPSPRHPAHAGALLDRTLVALVAGLVALQALLLAEDLCGIAWRRRTLAAGLAGLVLLGAALARAPRRRPVAVRPAPLTDPPGWGDAVALGALGLFAAACWSRRIAIPDFVYHWGVKGQRFFLAGGIDWAFLADPLRLTEHPDYPNLLPALYAATAHLRGYFDERAMLLWSVVWFAALAAAARAALAAVGGRTVRQAGLAVVAVSLAMFGIGYDMAGGADWLVALAVMLSLPALLRPRAERPAESLAERLPAQGALAAYDLRVGLAAALAAGAKIEGIPLALLLVAVRIMATRAPLTGGWSEAVGIVRRLLHRLPRLVGPAALVTLPWWLGNLRHGLFQPGNTGTWDPARPGIIATALPQALATVQWHGLPWLLLLLPALIAVRRTRAAGVLLALQTAFYLLVYLTAPVDTRFYVLSSLPRLLFHLVPPLMVATLVLAAPREVSGSPSSES